MDVLGTLGIQVLRVATSTTSQTMEKKFWLQRQKDFTIQQVTVEAGTNEAKGIIQVRGKPRTCIFLKNLFKNLAKNNLEWKHQQQ
jgi:hypothetical protein